MGLRTEIKLRWMGIYMRGEMMSWDRYRSDELVDRYIIKQL